MHTTTLAKQYDTLTLHERLPLIMAAEVRKDEAELMRLVKSAPKLPCTVPDHFGLAHAATGPGDLRSGAGCRGIIERRAEWWAG